MVLEGMNTLKIGNQVWFDLLATEFSRKVDQLKLHETSQIAEFLADGSATTCFKTVKILCLSYVEAAYLNRMGVEVPPGLFTAGQEVLIKKAIKDLKNVELIP